MAVSARKAKQFLEELANLRDEAASHAKFQQRFGQIYLSKAPHRSYLQNLAVNSEGDSYREDRTDSELLIEFWLLPLRDTLREIWKHPDIRVKEWGIFKIREVFFLQGDARLLHRPIGEYSDYALELRPPGECEQILLQFLRWADLIHYCASRDCPSPYFIAKRHSQKYCSEQCSQLAQREIKRKWWGEHGNQWRSAKTQGKRRTKQT
jgi:hypothetical protein